MAVFCASDDPPSCEALQDELGAKYFEVLATTGNKLSGSDDALSEYLLDVGLLRASTVFFGTGSSNLGRFVSFLRGPEKLSLSLDVDFNAIPF